MGRRVDIILNGKSIGAEFISDEFADLVANYNFKDMKEVSDILFHVSRCTRKGYFDWCPADTKNLKKYLGAEV